jgi:uncharacterized Zn finger protein (UPF0148 family)
MKYGAQKMWDDNYTDKSAQISSRNSKCPRCKSFLILKTIPRTVAPPKDETQMAKDTAIHTFNSEDSFDTELLETVRRRRAAADAADPGYKIRSLLDSMCDTSMASSSRADESIADTFCGTGTAAIQSCGGAMLIPLSLFGANKPPSDNSSATPTQSMEEFGTTALPFCRQCEAFVVRERVSIEQRTALSDLADQVATTFSSSSGSSASSSNISKNKSKKMPRASSIYVQLSSSDSSTQAVANTTNASSNAQRGHISSLKESLQCVNPQTSSELVEKLKAATPKISGDFIKHACSFPTKDKDANKGSHEHDRVDDSFLDATRTRLNRRMSQMYTAVESDDEDEYEEQHDKRHHYSNDHENERLNRDPYGRPSYEEEPPAPRVDHTEQYVHENERDDRDPYGRPSYEEEAPTPRVNHTEQYVHENERDDRAPYGRPSYEEEPPAPRVDNTEQYVHENERDDRDPYGRQSYAEEPPAPRVDHTEQYVHENERDDRDPYDRQSYAEEPPTPRVDNTEQYVHENERDDRDPYGRQSYAEEPPAPRGDNTEQYVHENERDDRDPYGRQSYEEEPPTPRVNNTEQFQSKSANETTQDEITRQQDTRGISLVHSNMSKLSQSSSVKIVNESWDSGGSLCSFGTGPVAIPQPMDCATANVIPNAVQEFMQHAKSQLDERSEKMAESMATFSDEQEMANTQQAAEASQQLDYDTRRDIAAMAIGQKLTQGYRLTEILCETCRMPFLDRNGQLECVACPAIMLEAIERSQAMNANDRGSTKPSPRRNEEAKSLFHPAPRHEPAHQFHEKKGHDEDYQYYDDHYQQQHSMQGNSIDEASDTAEFNEDARDEMPPKLNNSSREMDIQQETNIIDDAIHDRKPQRQGPQRANRRVVHHKRPEGNHPQERLANGSGSSSMEDGPDISNNSSLYFQSSSEVEIANSFVIPTNAKVKIHELAAHPQRRRGAVRRTGQQQTIPESTEDNNVSRTSANSARCVYLNSRKGYLPITIYSLIPQSLFFSQLSHKVYVRLEKTQGIPRRSIVVLVLFQYISRTPGGETPEEGCEGKGGQHSSSSPSGSNAAFNY